MAPKRNFRPSAARAALIACIAVISVLAFLTTDVSACNCYSGRVVNPGAKCYRYWNRQGQYWNLPVGNYYYPIYCQKEGAQDHGNSWWNYVKMPSGSYCYVNDYYLSTGCANKCDNQPTCRV